MSNWDKALVTVVKELNKNKLDYVLVASGALRVLGVRVTPQDIDIFTTEKELRKCYKIFSNVKTTKLYYYKDNEGKYLEFKAVVGGVPIEFCELKTLDLGATMQVSFKGAKAVVPNSDTTTSVDFEGVGVTVPKNTIEQELERNRKLKNHDTVGAIGKYLKRLG
jgi:hypothetical protein